MVTIRSPSANCLGEGAVNYRSRASDGQLPDLGAAGAVRPVVAAAGLHHLDDDQNCIRGRFIYISLVVYQGANSMGYKTV